MLRGLIGPNSSSGLMWAWASRALRSSGDSAQAGRSKSRVVSSSGSEYLVETTSVNERIWNNHEPTLKQCLVGRYLRTVAPMPFRPRKPELVPSFAERLKNFVEGFGFADVVAAS